MKSFFIKNFTITAFIFSIIVFLLGLYIGEYHKFAIATKPNEFGEFGSFIGGICGLIAAFASIFAIKQAIVINKGQTEQFERQSFESGFFNLISLFNERINSLELKDKTIKGSAVFEIISTEFEEKTDNHLNNEKTYYLNKIKLLIEKTYKNEFSILLLSFKTITKYVDESRMQVVIKHQFISIFYSFLTVAEVELLNRIGRIDDEIKKIFEKYPNKLLH
jgi:S-methylmethionine-dependent homocysteine/selenocysteine methylase